MMVFGLFDTNVAIYTKSCTIYFDFLPGLLFSLLVSSCLCFRFLPGDVVVKCYIMVRDEERWGRR